jgi:hypothetical protein
MYDFLYDQYTTPTTTLPSKISSMSRCSKFRYDPTQTFTILVEPFVQMYQTIGCQPAEQGGVLGGDREQDLITAYYHDVHATRTSVQYDPSFEAINRGVFPVWGVDLIGVGHTHPGLPEPSSGDLVYANQLLNHMTRLRKFFMPILLPEQNNGGIFKFLPYVMLKKPSGNQVVKCAIKIIDNNGREISQQKALEFKVDHINTVPSLDEIDVVTKEEIDNISIENSVVQEQPDMQIVSPTNSIKSQPTTPLVTLAAYTRDAGSIKPSTDVLKTVINYQNVAKPPISQLEKIIRSGCLRELRTAITPESGFVALEKIATATFASEGLSLQHNLTQIRSIFPKTLLPSVIQTPFPGQYIPPFEYGVKDEEFFASVFSTRFPMVLLLHLGKHKNRYGNPYIHPELLDLIIDEFSKQCVITNRKKQSILHTYQTINNYPERKNHDLSSN